MGGNMKVRGNSQPTRLLRRIAFATVAALAVAACGGSDTTSDTQPAEEAAAVYQEASDLIIKTGELPEYYMNRKRYDRFKKLE
jgi:nitrous oxide reductase